MACWSAGTTISAMRCSRRSVRRSPYWKPCETDREVGELKTLSDVLYVANKIANRSSSWRDPELDGEVDTSMLDTLFDAETLAEIVEESEEEVQSLKAALGG